MGLVIIALLIDSYFFYNFLTSDQSVKYPPPKVFCKVKEKTAQGSFEVKMLVLLGKNLDKEHTKGVMKEAFDNFCTKIIPLLKKHLKSDQELNTIPVKRIEENQEGTCLVLAGGVAFSYYHQKKIINFDALNLRNLF